MAEIKIEVNSKGNNKVSATNSIVNSISEKIQLIHNEILEKIAGVRTWYLDIQQLCNNAENKVNIAIESIETSIKEECQSFVDECKDYATSNDEVDAGLYSAKHYAEISQNYAVSNEVVEELESGEELYSAKHYAETMKEEFDKIGEFIEGYILGEA